MFDILSLTAHDTAMLAAGGIAVACGIAGFGIVHRAAPSVGAWLSKEKTSFLALEDKMKSAFGLASRAIANVEAKSAAGDQAVLAELHASHSLLQGDTNAVATRVAALEAVVFGKPTPALLPAQTVKAA